jgi:hypothetical protein
MSKKRDRENGPSDDDEQVSDDTQASAPVEESPVEAPLVEYPKMLYVTPHRHQMVVNSAEEEARVLAAYEGER